MVAIMGLRNRYKRKLKMQRNKVLIIFFVLTSLNIHFCYSQQYSKNEYVDIINGCAFVEINDTIDFVYTLLELFKEDVETINTLNRSLIEHDFDKDTSAVSVGGSVVRDEFIQWTIICYVEKLLFNDTLKKSHVYILNRKKCKKNINYNTDYINFQRNLCLINGDVYKGANNFFEYVKKLKYSKSVIGKVYQIYYKWAKKIVRKHRADTYLNHPLEGKKYELIQIGIIGSFPNG